MEDSKTPEIREILCLERLYWTSSVDESSASDFTASRSDCESPTSAVSEQQDILLIKEEVPEKHETEEDSEPSVFEGQGVASPEIPQPTTPSQRVTRCISDSPITKRIHSPLPDTHSLPSPSDSKYRNRYRRVTFDRVLDLSLIQARARDSPKPQFSENGDVLSPISPSSVKLNSPRSIWEPRLSTPGKVKKNLVSSRSGSGSGRMGWSGDFMASEGGLGLRAASWSL